METKTQKPIEIAIGAVGGMTNLARLLKSKGLPVNGRAVVYQWVQTQVPAEYCPSIEWLTGVTCENLRPNLIWLRVPDAQWPITSGRPLLDFTAASVA